MQTEQTHRSAGRGKRTLALLLGAALLVPVLLINPFREMLSEDDSWAYARMVQHLLATRKYQLDSWSAANMPVQIYLAAGLAKVFGFSLSLVRLTTVFLFIMGSLSFYLLLRELGRDRSVSTLATLALCSSPLVLMLTFTFMSDIQFLGWLLVSLWLTVRGICRSSPAIMLAGSLAAGCAIGTRQFGVAVIVGLFVSSMTSGKEISLRSRLLLPAVAVPVLAAGAQLYMGLRGQNFTQVYRIWQVHQFWSEPATALIKEIIWRSVVISQYVGICLLPLLPLSFARKNSHRHRTLPMWRAVGAVTAAAIVFAVILSIGSPITSRPEAQHHGLWEPLELYWLLPTQLHRLPGVMRFLDLAGIAGAIYLFYGSPSKISRDRSPGPEVTARVFLAVTGISLLLLHLSYVQLNDTYITALIPFAILIATDRIDARRLSNALFRWSVAVSALLILLTAVWMRSEYAGQEAYWRSADALVRAGVCPDDIEAPLHWAEYHGGFDAWIAAGAPGFSFSEPSTGGRDALHDPFYSWINNRMQYASFRIVQGDPGTDPAGWHVIDCVQFRNAAFGRRWIVTLKRNASLPVTSVEKCENQLP